MKMSTENPKKRVVNSRPLFYAFLALLLSISTARYVFLGSVKYIIIVALFLCLLVGLCVWEKRYKTMALLLAIFAFGLGWYFVGYNSFVGTSYSGELVHVSGRISDDVSYSSYGGQVTVVLKDVKIDGKSESNISLVITYSSQWEQGIGDKVEFDGEVENVSLYTLGSFNSYYYRDRTPYTCTISSEDVNVVGHKLTISEKFRLKVKGILSDNMSESNATTAYAVLFGDKSQVDDSTLDAYQNAGIVHILTVSGLHISFLFALLGWLLKKCHVKGMIGVLMCGVLAFLYAYLCGFTPSVLRASIMGIVLYFTRTSGRCYDALSSLGLSGIIILLFKPLFAHDIGFLMSYFCVLSIYIISPILFKLFKKFLPKKIAQAIAFSVGITLGILPFLAQMYNSFNLLSFFVNLFVLPVFSILYPLLLIFVILVLIVPFMKFVLWLPNLIFSGIFLFADFFGTTNLTVSLQPFEIFLVAACYVCFFVVSKFFMTNLRTKSMCVGGFLLICACLYAVSGTGTVEGVSYAYYYSQSVVVLTNSSGESVVVDLASESFTKNLLKSLNIKSISTLFLLQDTTFDTELSSDLGVVQVIRADGGQGYSNEVVCELEETSSVSGFSFCYRGYNSRLLGLEISYDNFSVFILKDRTASESALASLSENEYNLVLLGKQDQYSCYFSGRILTYYDCQDCFSSYQKNGNVLVETNYKRRCLD